MAHTTQERELGNRRQWKTVSGMIFPTGNWKR
jgi:hypothetical protein